MKNLLTSIFAFLLIGFIPFNAANAQTSFEFCGSTFNVIFNPDCSATVDFNLGDNVAIFKVWNGGDEIIALNTYKGDFIPSGITLNSADFPFGIIPPGENYYLDIQTTDCGSTTFNISQVIAANCVPAPGIFDICGSTFSINCDGTVDFNLADNVDIFKVWNGGDEIIALNTYKGDFIPSGIWFNSTDFPFGVIPSGENYYLDIQTSDCGDYTLNISQWLAANCPDQGYRKYEEKEILDISAYPNPTNSFVNLELPLVDDQYLINVYNMGGQLVKEMTSAGGNTTIDMSTFNSGLYAIRVQSNEYTYTEKIKVLK